MAYANGQHPEHLFEELGRGWDQYGQWKHLAPSGTAARWRELRRLAWEKYGIWLVITAGWNVYRPLWVQRLYRTALGIWAAVPGYSSHGGSYQGRESMAIDVANWRALGATEAQAWSRFVALCRLVGFTVDFVTPRELWHIGDFSPWSVPQFAAIVINPITTNKPAPEEEEEDDMSDFTVHARAKTTNGEDDGDWTLGHKDIGQDLEPFVFPYTAEQAARFRRTEGDVTIYRGFKSTKNRAIATAWMRTHAKGISKPTSRTIRADYIEIQVQLSAEAAQIADRVTAV